MNNENSNSSQAERFVDQTVNRLQKSLRNTIIAAILILGAECIYFTVLNSKISEGLTAVPDMVEAYRGDFDNINQMAKNIPDVSTYSSQIAQAEKYVDMLIEHDANKYTNEVTQVLDVLDKVKRFDVNKYTNQIEQTQMVLDLINEANDSSKIASRIGRAVVNELDTQGNVVAHYATELLSENLDTLPEWVKAQIPKHSNRLQDKTELWINQFCVATSDELGSTFDTFIDDHAEKIKAFSEAADDEEALKQLDGELTVMLATFMSTTPIKDHGTLEEQSQQFLKRLQAANAMLQPLANNKKENLTPDQQLLRRTIGIFMHKLDGADFGQNN